MKDSKKNNSKKTQVKQADANVSATAGSNNQVYELTGFYAIDQFSQILDILKKLPYGVYVNYEHASLDTGIRIILDNFNAKNMKQGAERQAVMNQAQSVESASTYAKGLLEELMNRPAETIIREQETSFIKYMVNFLSHLFCYTWDVLRFLPKILRKRAQHDFQREIVMEDTINSCYNMGVQAIPIVLFLSCSWGVIAALQSCMQLRTFGAEYYSIDLLIFVFFKEMGILLSNIVLAARSGSSMIAKIGIMRISDEWNALQVLGIDPEVFLLRPRIIAFIILMPFISYISIAAATLGGYIVLHNTIGISAWFVLDAVSRVATWSLFLSVFWKAPIFGVIIGMICAYEAKSITLNSENVVQAITRGVVYSVFACVLADMLINVIAVSLGFG